MQTHDMAHLQQKMLDRYRLLQRLGRGSMGEVWEAEDTELSRQVAIKILHPVLRQEEDYLQAFANEARLASLLDHPHILPVHDFGEVSIDDDVFTYLVFPLITGGSLHNLIHQHEDILPVATSLQYLRQAAEAIDFAHNHGLLHRAIKPSNMLLQDHWLFLSDFSLARLLTTKTYRSRTHAGTGTPEYMAPEQILGHTETASDRYSLAVIAYQLLTGHVPFQGQNPYDVFTQHLQQTPPAPRQFNQHMPPPVEDILLKGLAKNPAERYHSCLAFVDALEKQYQSAGTPIHGSNTTNKLHRRAFLIGGGAAAIFLAGSGAALITALINNQKHVGPQQLMAGIPRLKLTGHTDAVTSIHWRPQGRYLASTSLDTRLAIWDIDTALAQHTSGATMLKSWKFGNPVDGNSFNWSPDGQTLAIAQGGYSDKNLPDFINILPVVGPQQPTMSYSDGHYTYSNQQFISLAYSPDATWIAATMTPGITDTTQAKIAALWRVGTTQAIAKTLQNNGVTTGDSSPSLIALAWSPDAVSLAGWRSDFKLVIWQPAHSDKPLTITSLPSRPHNDSVDELVTFRGVSLPQVSLCWSPTTGSNTGNLLAIADLDIVAIFDQQHNKITHMLGIDDPLLTQQQLVNDTPYYAQLTSLSWSSNGRYLAGSYVTGKKIFIWDLQNPHPQTKNDLQLPDITFGQSGGHSANILGLAWSPDGRYLASSALDKTIIIWQVDRTENREV